jgi:hypothetical protein
VPRNKNIRFLGLTTLQQPSLAFLVSVVAFALNAEI